MKAWTFSRKVSASIALTSLVVVMVVSGFVYVTFKHWTESQEVDLLDAKLRQFELQLGEVGFISSLLNPGSGEGTGMAALFEPDLSSLESDLDEGQYLQMLDSSGLVLAEVGTEEQVNNDVKYTAERDIELLVFGTVKLQLMDSGHSRSATAEREIGRLLLLGLLIAAVVSVITGWIVARSALKPIRMMIGEVRSIGANNLSQRLHLPVAKDELHQLGETFNSFLHKLDVSFEQQRRFVSDASHELKTPIAIIEGHTHMIQRWGKKSPEVLDESLAFMMDETKRMKELIAQLLLLAEAEEPLLDGVGEVCDLHDTLRELIPQTVHVNPEVILDYDGSPIGEAILIRMPRGASYQVLRNIVENAFKYTPKGGTVSISHFIKDGQAIVIVEDTGIGISSEQLPHIFDRFYRTEGSRNRAQGGSGLGLAIAKAIMERYGGSIHIDSTLGQGTKVTLRFIGE
ncbi:HAMP domain-containing protein [Paenibacillus anaericanus]|uniref:histidine kinase n=1 Tax=Paenibacillus anaericanus TaxID=170367 RepID=A0A433YBH3_9BACL|nr:ATP-binding protein [Paenibacillus anaericanus]RUT47215.1 HAMP domain-containing protein [Paenibacillus anaericanus]